MPGTPGRTHIGIKWCATCVVSYNYTFSPELRGEQYWHMGNLPRVIIDMLSVHPSVRPSVRPSVTKSTQQLQISCNDLHNIWPNEASHHVALNKFEDEWPWPIFLGLFYVAMKKLVSAITSDFMHRFRIWPSDTYHHNLGWVRRWATLTYFSRSQCYISLVC